MPKHTITAEIPAIDIGNADVCFKIRKDGAVIGTLMVSKGSLEWAPRDHTYGYELTWSDLDPLLQAHGRKTKR